MHSGAIIHERPFEAPSGVELKPSSFGSVLWGITDVCVAEHRFDDTGALGVFTSRGGLMAVGRNREPDEREPLPFAFLADAYTDGFEWEVRPACTV